MDLARYASKPEASRGRLVRETGSPTRSDFQRDRDRVIHSTAFRRLKHKTQVFIHHEGDHFRTRLTHTIEVAQVARSLARGLRLNEDLAEALALAHDLGHPPFGHTGEESLDRLMAEHGGFDHNAQSLRIVTELEQRYATFDGLNLTWETLEGLVKHNGPLIDGAGSSLDALPFGFAQYCRRQDLWLHTHASPEAQVAAIADDIAYDSHDIDDGLRAGYLTVEDVREMPVAGRALAEVDRLHPGLETPRVIHEVLRRVLTWLIEDVFAEAGRRLARLDPDTADAVRLAGHPVVGFSNMLASEEQSLKAFLFAKVYRNERIMWERRNADRIVSDLFARYLDEPGAMPDGHGVALAGTGESDRARGVCDFIAGMTDRFAVQEHRRLFALTPDLR